MVLVTVEHTIVTSTSLPSPAKPSLILIGTVTTKGNTVTVAIVRLYRPCGFCCTKT
jgi:hypothetical protein